MMGVSSAVLSSENLVKAGTVSFKKHPALKVGTRSRALSVDLRFAAGLHFQVSEFQEFEACRDSGKFR